MLQVVAEGHDLLLHELAHRRLHLRCSSVHSIIGSPLPRRWTVRADARRGTSCRVSAGARGRRAPTGDDRHQEPRQHDHLRRCSRAPWPGPGEGREQGQADPVNARLDVGISASRTATVDSTSSPGVPGGIEPPGEPPTTLTVRIAPSVYCSIRSRITRRSVPSPSQRSSWQAGTLRGAARPPSRPGPFDGSTRSAAGAADPGQLDEDVRRAAPRKALRAEKHAAAD